MKYGTVNEDLPAAPVARVLPECLPALRAVGLASWASTARDKNPIEVRVTRTGESGPGPYPLPPPAAVGSAAVQALVAEIHAATRAIWLEPPSEVLDIHTGRAASRAGSYDQYFSTVVFVNGEERALAYNAFGGLLKCAKQSDVALSTLVAITPHFVSVPTEFLGYCGLHTLERLSTSFLALLPQLRSTAEYVAVLSALTLYANKLNGWNLHYFPWHHGQDYPYPAEPG